MKRLARYVDHIAVSPELREALSVLCGARDAGPEAMGRVAEFLQSCPDAFSIKRDPLFAIGTNDMVITLEPTKRLMELVHASRTREGELQVAGQG